MMNRPDDAIIYYTVTVFALMECDEDDDEDEDVRGVPTLLTPRHFGLE
jgi:hypothetical protein